MTTRTRLPDDLPTALLGLAFASGESSSVSRSLAWISPAEAGIDLLDPERRKCGDYELLELLGEGGMGAVYRATQFSLDREVAIKFLAAGPWASEEFIARFRREARAAARLQHPNIVEIYETGEWEGMYFFSMRLVRGPTLAQWIAERGPMAPREAAALTRTLADAMDYAHRLGVLHLDLKPGNVLLAEGTQPLIADFGLARRMDEGPDGDGGTIAGTPGYMAPEQITARQSAIGPASDIYGLGGILYCLLVGQPPFAGTDPQATLHDVLRCEPPPLSSVRRNVPRDLEAICLRCLAKDPASRYPDARALSEDLGRFLSRLPVSARRMNPAERLVRWARRRPAEACTFLALALGVAGTSWQMQEATAAQHHAEAQHETAERARLHSARMVDLLAAAFPRPTDQRSTDALDGAAGRIVDWLHAELAGDEAMQASVLGDLLDALERADNPAAAQALLYPIVSRLGSAYWRQAAEELVRRGTPGDLIRAATLLDPAGDAAVEARRSQLLAQALAMGADGLDHLAVAVYYCGNSAECGAHRPAQRMAELEPDNGANWLLAIEEANSPQTEVLLQRAAAAQRFDDHFGRVVRVTLEAVRSAEAPLPAALRLAAARLAPDVPEREVVGYFVVWWMSIPAWSRLLEACSEEGVARAGTPAVADCAAVGHRAAYEAGSLLANLIGSTIIRRVQPGGAEAWHARELRRHYVYVQHARALRTAEQVRASRDELMGRDLLEFGEMEAFKRTLDRAGIPRDPPDDWAPEDPEQLMTSFERERFRQERAALALGYVPTPPRR